MIVPVMGIYTLKAYTDLSERLGKEVRWWKRDSLLYIPTVLFNPIDHFKYWDVRESLEIDKDVSVFCDSGGFQFLQGRFKEDLDIRKVIEWQKRNADYAFIMDAPPGKGVMEKWTGVEDLDWIKKCLEITKRNTEVYVQEKEGSETKFFLVSQGYAVDTIRFWIDEMMEYAQYFEGWGVSGSYFGADRLVYATMYLYSLGEYNKLLHFLGFSQKEGLVVLAYIGKRVWKNKYFFDNSTWTLLGAKYRKILVPLGYGGSGEVCLNLRGERRSYEGGFFCSCVYCKAMEEYWRSQGGEGLKDLKKLETTWVSLGLSLHNLWVMYQWWRFWEGMAEDRDEFERFVKEFGLEKVLSLVDFVDEVVTVGFESACKKIHWSLVRYGVGKKLFDVVGLSRENRNKEELEDKMIDNGDRVGEDEEVRDIRSVDVYSCYGGYEEGVCLEVCDRYRSCKEVKEC